jgi:hypothetical protein
VIEMAKLIKDSKYNYTNINNQLVRDDRLSWKARGIFSYLWSQSDNWNFYVSEIAKHSPDGKTSLQTGLKELEELGYLKRKPRQDNQNKLAGFDWILSDFPPDRKPVQRETRPTGNQPLSINNNKNYQQQEISTKKDISKSKNHQKGLGHYGNVYLSKEKLGKLKSEFPNNWEQWIERVDSYCQSTGKKYKDYLATIRNWDKKDRKKVDPSDPWNQHYE